MHRPSDQPGTPRALLLTFTTTPKQIGRQVFPKRMRRNKYNNEASIGTTPLKALALRDDDDDADDEGGEEVAASRGKPRVSQRVLDMGASLAHEDKTGAETPISEVCGCDRCLSVCVDRGVFPGAGCSTLI